MSRILEDTSTPATEPVVEESKADAFRRLANKRVTVALDKIRLIGNLSSRGNYEYTDEQVAAIESALARAMEDTIKLFRKSAATKPTFEL